MTQTQNQANQAAQTQPEQKLPNTQLVSIPLPVFQQLMQTLGKMPAEVAGKIYITLGISAQLIAIPEEVVESAPTTDAATDTTYDETTDTITGGESNVIPA